MSENDQVPIVVSREDAIIKLKSILKSESQINSESRINAAKSSSSKPNGINSTINEAASAYDTNEHGPPSMRSRNQSIEPSASVGIRFSQMVNLREYDGELAPETVRSTKQQPIYRVANFRTDENDFIVESTPSELVVNRPVKKVQLESFKITRHHLNGVIKAKSMSLDQQCYIRITTDNWVTFQETEAIDTGDESSPMLTKYHFDFIIPIPRHDKSNNDSNTNNNFISSSSSGTINSSSPNSTNSNTNNNTNNSSSSSSPPTSQTNLQSSTSLLRNLTMQDSQTSTTSMFSIKDCPTGIEFFVVLKSLGMLYIDDNEKLKYKLMLITPRASVVPVISLGPSQTSVTSSSSAF